MHEIGVQPSVAVGMPSSSGCVALQVERVPAHVRDLQAPDRPARCARRRRRSSRGPRHVRFRGRARPSTACRRRCRGTAAPCCAPPRPAPRPCRGTASRPRAAIGEGADARQHDAVGAATASASAVTTIAGQPAVARGALEGLRGRAQVARAVVDDGDAHRGASGSGKGRGCVVVRPRSAKRRRGVAARRTMRAAPRADQLKETRLGRLDRRRPTASPPRASRARKRRAPHAGASSPNRTRDRRTKRRIAVRRAAPAIIRQRRQTRR